MAKTQRNFISGRMNKSLDERLIPNGEYTDALNVRLGSTENSEIGSVENSKGNTKITSLQYIDSRGDVYFLSDQARCLGVFEDGQNNRIYWFVHDPAFSVGQTQKLDLIVSLNPSTGNLTYHVVSIDDGSGVNTTLNFNPTYLITAVSKIENLLFFTDNYNPPRVINVLTNYANPSFETDGFTEEQLQVIKKPPLNAPRVILKKDQVNADDFLEGNFICFAYRYQYENGEYSASSQWSEPAFDPGRYGYSFASNLNEGMVNTITGVDVEFNAGSALVNSIQILYKQMNDSTIKIIDKLDKSQLGYNDDTNYTYTFNSSKIFTVLPETELLRLYDNVPTKAQAQTVMGNRLMYGNYIEGYDLVDLFNNPLKLEYRAYLSNTPLVNTNLPVTYEAGVYTYGSSQSISDSVMVIDLSQLDPYTSFVSGSSLSIEFVFEHSVFDPTAGQPTTQTENVSVEFSYTLVEQHTSVFELVNSTRFQEAIGTASNIKPVYDATNPTSCSGFTLTDNVNCYIPPSLSTPSGTVYKYASGITSSTTVSGEPIAILDNNPSSTSLKLQLPAMRFVSSTGSPSGGFYEYYKIISGVAQYNSAAIPTSLHSNRGYEVGIVYMDEYLRSSTALVSTNNTIQIPCDKSKEQNQLHVNIPWGQRAPKWAKRYKFVLKPTEGSYETIYSEQFFKHPQSNSFFFLLEGENAAKVETGQRLIVKRDSGGAVEQCVYATVLEKSTEVENFLTIPNPLDPSENILVPGGAYMEMVPNGFNVTSAEQTGGNIVTPLVNRATFPIRSKIRGYPVAAARVNVLDPAGTAYVDYTIPVNSIITLRIKQVRRGDLNNLCEERINEFFRDDLLASATYSDFKAWFDGDNIGDLIAQDSTFSNSDGSETTNTYDNTLLTGAATEPESNIRDTESSPYIAVAPFTNTYQFYRSSGDNSLWFLATGTRSCKRWSGIIGGHSSNAEIEIIVERANAGGVVVFETLPSSAMPDIWYENDLSFPVSEVGEHEGNLQNQNIQTQNDAIIDTKFFNCYSYGNGVESYQIRDSITGSKLVLGNRVTTTSAQEYKEAHRFADITYSGTYSDESNVNRLNEFNLGLLNFKPLEELFGSVQKLVARETDILTLQEDKISYVLAGKNLLSDAGGFGALTSVPTVLGQQIARLEKFGISRNPESFAEFGENKYFTDEQRGAVIHLKGGSYQNEQLKVISEFGMRPWFRDLFISSFDTQKLGGFDPYMNEYVLSSNTQALPFAGDCDLCGSSRDITLQPSTIYTYCVNVTQDVGTVNIDYVIPNEGTDLIITELSSENVITELNGEDIGTEIAYSGTGYTISALYNGTTVTTGVVYTSGTLTVDKNSVYADEIIIEVSTTNTTSDTIEVTVGCPIPIEMSIYQICLTSNADRGKFIHNEYRWVDGNFISPLHSELVEFKSGNKSPLLSQYTSLTGSQGSGVIPYNGAEVKLISNKIDFDDYDFVFYETMYGQRGRNNFRYLRSDTFYGNTDSDIASLLAASTEALPIYAGRAPEYSATFTMPASGKNLYLIYDYRVPQEVYLCKTSVSLQDGCCTCGVPPTPTPTLTPTPTALPCTTYTLASPSGNEVVFWYNNCKGNMTNITLPAGQSLNVCASDAPQQNAGSGSAGTITPGAACTEYYYKATPCGTNVAVFLTGNTSLGLFAVNDVVKYTNDAGGTSCATITQVNVGTGTDGNISTQASGCLDATNCPQPQTVYQWVISARGNSGSATSISCADSTYCCTSVFTTVADLASVVTGSTVFYSDYALNNRFIGGSQYYGVAPPASGTIALCGFKDGVLRMDNNGTASAVTICP